MYMAKKVIAIIGIVFMVIFSVSIVFVFVDPKMLNGLFGYIALLSAIAGAACFVVVKYVFKEDKDYLPNEDGDKGETKDDAKPEGAEDTNSTAETQGANDGKVENNEDAATENTTEKK